MKRLAATLLERTFGVERAGSIIGDLEEDLTRGRTPPTWFEDDRGAGSVAARLALGAPPARVMTAVIGRGVVHTAAGVAIGVAAAGPLASSVEAFLFEVRPHDPVVYGAAAALLGACGVIAAFVPARRAARVDPAIALRVE